LSIIVILIINRIEQFNKYKEELNKTNKDLHIKLFEEELDSDGIEVKNIYPGDEPKFLFFFNKRIFTRLSMHECHVIFPRV
jgi:hypothetical protein